MGRETPEYALWFDLESTGLGEEDLILEVAAVLTRVTPGFEELGSFETPVASPGLSRSFELSAFARDAHTRNGLLAEIAAGRGMALGDAEKAVLAMVDGWTKDRVVMAGSGVGHFDHPFIATRMPELHRRLVYFDLDVGPVRRFARIAGMEIAEEDHPHRAMGCLREALDQGRTFNRVLLAGASAAR